MALGGADLADDGGGACRRPSRSRARPGVISGRGRPVDARVAVVQRRRRAARRRRSCRSPRPAPRSRRGGPRGGTGCSCPTCARRGTCASPRRRRRRARRWPRAPSRPTRARRARSPSPATTARGRPRGPGCTTRQRCCAQIDSGIIVLSIGQTISCGPVLVDRRLHRGGRVDDRDRHLVAQLGQRDPRALAEAVVGRDEEEDPQRPRVARLPSGPLRPISPRAAREPHGGHPRPAHAPNQPSHAPKAIELDVPKTPPRTALLPVKLRTGRLDVPIVCLKGVTARGTSFACEERAAGAP